MNQAIDYQPTASGILTQSSRYKRAENNLLVDEKGPQYFIQIVVWVMHLNAYTIFIDVIIKTLCLFQAKKKINEIFREIGEYVDDSEKFLDSVPENIIPQETIKKAKDFSK